MEGPEKRGVKKDEGKDPSRGGGCFAGVQGASENEGIERERRAAGGGHPRQYR